MTTLKTNAIEPEGATTDLTIGMTGQNVVIGGSGGIKANTFKDAGGNTLWTSNGSGTLSSVSGFGGAQVLIQSQTASSSAYIDFTTGITSTYKEYVFEYHNVHPNNSNKYIDVSFSTDGGSSWGITKTTTAFTETHTEAGTASLSYMTGWDLHQATGRVRLSNGAGTDNDMCIVGEFHLFNPSSTTYVKHFYGRSSTYEQTPMATDSFISGYLNTTTAINAVRFQMSAYNMDDGTIKMYGIK